MSQFHCFNCGDCCGPVPVNELELKRIRKSLSRMPKHKLECLKNQKRDQLTCMFRDTENEVCGIYNMRPEICKMFGFYEGMVCPRNTDQAMIGRKEGFQRLNKGGKQAEILTIQINWDNIMQF
jgi:Fe-S-cluster containining protein